MRTRLGKISGKKSGDGAKELTDRDQWIVDKFSFLQSHISRMQGKQAVNVSDLLKYVTPYERLASIKQYHERQKAKASAHIVSTLATFAIIDTSSNAHL